MAVPARVQLGNYATLAMPAAGSSYALRAPSGSYTLDKNGLASFVLPNADLRTGGIWALYADSGGSTGQLIWQNSANFIYPAHPQEPLSLPLAALEHALGQYIRTTWPDTSP